MHVAIIPARAGSKSIPNKNLQKVGNKTLVQHTIDWALRQKFKRIILSTNMEALLEDSMDGKIEKLHREERFSEDRTAMRDVVTDAIKKMEVKMDDIVWLLQPTSPFRKDEDFKKIERLILDGGTKSVISVRRCISDHPDRMYTIRNSWLKPLRFNNFDNKEDLMKTYIRNGCYYVFRSFDFRSVNTFLIHPCVPYEMSDVDSINIDSPIDLITARAIHGKSKANPTV